MQLKDIPQISFNIIIKNVISVNSVSENVDYEFYRL